MESENLRDIFKQSAELKEKVKVMVPRRLLERILVLGDDPEVNEEMMLR